MVGRVLTLNLTSALQSYHFSDSDFSASSFTLKDPCNCTRVRPQKGRTLPTTGLERSGREGLGRFLEKAETEPGLGRRATVKRQGEKDEPMQRDSEERKGMIHRHIWEPYVQKARVRPQAKREMRL